MNSCDYIKDTTGTLWIVAGNVHPSESVLAYPVYEPRVAGTRVLDGVRYEKVINQKENFLLSSVALDAIVTRYEPRACYSHAHLPSDWQRVADAIEHCGVPHADIGIFGSYLLGFPVVKDIDFVVYGVENRRKLFSRYATLRHVAGARAISPEHVAYQIAKKGSVFSPENSWSRLLQNKWSSLQFGEGILSTIRFVYKTGEEPAHIWDNEIIGSSSLEGVVRDAEGSDFHPRQFSLETTAGRFSVGTYFWIYQSCVRDGDRVRVTGNLREHNCLTLDEFSHSIQYL